MTELERRLSGWSPAPVALDRDRMLFDAGRASVKGTTPGRLLTALAASLAALAVAFGGWALQERAQRRSLEFALAERARSLEVVHRGRLLALPEPASMLVATPAPTTYLALSHRLATGGLEVPESNAAPAVHDQGSPSPARSLTPLNARRPGGLVDL
jgi:hypothetical protein